jgi:hypothetical protein
MSRRTFEEQISNDFQLSAMQGMRCGTHPCSDSSNRPGCTLDEISARVDAITEAQAFLIGARKLGAFEVGQLGRSVSVTSSCGWSWSKRTLEEHEIWFGGQGSCKGLAALRDAITSCLQAFHAAH